MFLNLPKCHFSTALKIPSFLRLPRKTLTMAEIRPGKSKRPTCPTCTRPSWLCLCDRIKTIRLENRVAVTILQHSLEKKHPFNSARIALLGLKNATFWDVSDVNFEAQFDIRLLESEYEAGLVCNDVAPQVFVKCPNEKSIGLTGDNGKCEFVTETETSLETCHEKRVENFDEYKVANEGHVITAKIKKQGVMTSFDHVWTCQDKLRKPNFDTILEIQEARDALKKGFVVQKLQNRQRGWSVKLEEFVEFELEVPPGSVLLFPSDKAVFVDEIKAIDFEFKNLIVLDGTWAKAKRMYAENPWLKLLPHVKLEMDKVSLFYGVRKQPKAWCLSTIESIVYALKAIEGGENLESLDELLNVFDSMVGDQRQFKEKRLKMAS